MKKKILVSAFLLFSNSSFSQEIDFKDIISLIVKNATNIQITKKNIEESFIDIKEQESKMLPKLELRGGASTIKQSNARTNNQNISLNLSYNIFNGGKTLNTINISNNNQKKSLIEHEKNIAETILLTTKVYYGVKKTRILKEAYEIAFKNNQNIMEKEKIKFENGVATKESYLNSQSSYYNIKAKLETLNNNIYSLESQYYSYTGATISKILPEIDLSDITIPSTMQEAIERAKVNSFNVQIAKIDLENANYNYQIAVASHSPEVNVYSSVEKQSGADNSVSFGLNYTMPLYSGGGDIAKQQKGVVAKKISKLKYNKIISDSELLAINAWKNYTSSKIEFDSYKKSLEAIKLSLEAEQIKYDSGYSDSGSLLELQDKKLKVQQEYTSAIEKKITSVMDMLIATGDFTAQNLEKIK